MKTADYRLVHEMVFGETCLQKVLPLNSLMKCELDGNDHFRMWRHSVGYILCNKLPWFVSELSEKDISTFREEATLQCF